VDAAKTLRRQHRIKSADGVGGVRSGQDGAVQRGGFQRVVPAHGHQGSADEAKGRKAIEQSHLAQRVGDIDGGVGGDGLSA
jgi:hypothetical protein